MKQDIISRALNELESAYIQEFLDTKRALAAKKPRQIPRIVRLIPIAAALCAVLTCGVILLPGLRRDGPPHDVGIGTAPVGSDTEESSPHDTTILPAETTVMTGTSTESDLPFIPPYNGEITTMTAEISTLGTISGIASKSEGDPSTGQTPGPATELLPPYFPVDSRDHNPILVARAVEVLPHTYENLPEYALIGTGRYRILKMEVIEPLYSGMSGTFYLCLPHNRYCDLTVYDCMIMALQPAGNLYRDLQTNELTSISPLFRLSTERWDVLPFTDNIFDESLWEHDGWRHIYDEVKYALDPEVRESAYCPWYQQWLVVCHGSTYAEAVSELVRLREAYLATVSDPEYYDIKVAPHFESAEALAVMDYVKSFENGAFDLWMGGTYFHAYRYINGCPTSEFISVYLRDGVEVVEYSAYPFEESDMAELPNLADYVASLDLSTITPPHIDTSIEGLKQGYCSAAGWYEKTADGVMCMVKIHWIYYTGKDYYPTSVYQDDLYIRVTADGTEMLTREEATALLGEDCIYISRFEQGEEERLPAV